ncbi:MAG: carbohydrate kinase family protein [Aggregatilineales bacterium]
MKFTDVLISGSVAYDYLMRFPGRFKDHLLPENLHSLSVSFLVDDMTRHWGGVGANIAYTLALLGCRPRLMATVGQDFNEYRARLESVGVDTRGVVAIDKVFTASFFANTDVDNNQIASFYSGAMAYARDYTVAGTLDQMPEYGVISPNDPVAMRQTCDEFYQLKIPFMYDPSQQVPRLSGDELRFGIERCHTLVVNEYEWGMIVNKTGMTREDVLRHAKALIITFGKRGAEIYADGRLYETPVYPVPDEGIIDPTGVGDAFRAGLIKGMMEGWPWEVTGRAAALCAAYVLEKVGTQEHHYTPEAFVARYRQVFDDDGVLDSMIHAKTPQRVDAS